MRLTGSRRTRIAAGIIFAALTACNGSGTAEPATTSEHPETDVTHSDTAAEQPLPTTSATTPAAEATTVEATITGSPWTPEEQEVIDAYDEAMDAYDEAAAPPDLDLDPDDPAMEEHFTGRELHDLTVSLEILNRNGTAYRYPEDSIALRETLSIALGEEGGVEVADVEICSVTDVEEILLETGDHADHSRSSNRPCDPYFDTGGWCLEGC